MAYQDDLLDDQQQAPKAGGNVLAGSGGAAGAQPQQQAGSGFTNLQQYLSANKGSGGGVADNIVNNGQTQFDTANKSAGDYADAWAKNATTNVNQAVGDVTRDYGDATNTLRNDAYAQVNPGKTYQGPADATKTEGYNDLDKNYQNAKAAANTYAGDVNAQKAGLQKQYGYGSGFGALDTFLGRQDGRDKIDNWSNNLQQGSAQKQIGQVNDAIAAGGKSIDTAKAGYNQAVKAADVIRKKEAAGPMAPKPDDNNWVALPDGTFMGPDGAVHSNKNGQRIDYDPEAAVRNKNAGGYTGF